MPCDIGMPVPYYFHTYCTWTDSRGHRDSALVLYNLIYGDRVMMDGRWSSRWHMLDERYPFAKQHVTVACDTLRLAYGEGLTDCDYRYTVSLSHDTLFVARRIVDPDMCEKHMRRYHSDMFIIGLPSGTYRLVGVEPDIVGPAVGFGSVTMECGTRRR